MINHLLGLTLMQEFLKSPSPGLLLILIYINVLSDGLSSNLKLFADDNSLFSIIRDINPSLNDSNDDLVKISNWAKQTQELIFTLKLNKSTHPPLVFNNNLVNQVISQKATSNDFRLQIKVR